MPHLRGCTLLGTFFHAPRPGSIETLAQALVRIDADGTIVQCLPATDPGYDDEITRATRAGTLVRLPAASVVLPGFVDLHLHAPQYPQLGTALDGRSSSGWARSRLRAPRLHRTRGRPARAGHHDGGHVRDDPSRGDAAAGRDLPRAGPAGAGRARGDG